MKKLLLIVMMALPLTMAAQWKSNDGQQKPLWGGTPGKEIKTRLTVGLYHSGDFYKNAAGVGLGLFFNIGRFSDLLNLSFGAEYIEYLGGDPRPEDTKNALGIVDGGAQIVIPAYLKLQLFNTSKWTKFYVGCGGEYGFRAREGGVLKHYYPEDHVLCEKSLAIVPIVGWKSRNLDFGLYYKHYLDEPFNHSLDGKKDFGEDKARIGYYCAFYF